MQEYYPEQAVGKIEPDHHYEDRTHVEHGRDHLRHEQYDHECPLALEVETGESIAIEQGENTYYEDRSERSDHTVHEIAVQVILRPYIDIIGNRELLREEGEWTGYNGLAILE